MAPTTLVRVIDPALLRENPDLVRRSQQARGNSPESVDEAIAADTARRAAINTFEALRAEQNAFGKTVAQAPKEDKPALVAQAKELSDRVKAAQGDVTAAEEAAQQAFARIENIVIDGVPAGGEDDYVVLREEGVIPAFDFEARDHLELGEMLGAIDMERGAKVSGARFYFLRGIGARLARVSSRDLRVIYALRSVRVSPDCDVDASGSRDPVAHR